MARNSGYASITAGSKSEPFWLQLARSQVIGHVPVNANGYNAAVGTTKEGVWANGGDINFPATASVMNVTSANTDDASAGTGARTITIWGLNSDWELASETVTLNGQTIVNTTTSFMRVFRAKCETFGSGATNAGIVYVFTDTATSGVPDTATEIFTTIPAGEGESLQAFYTVPANHTAYMLDISFNCYVAADEYCNVKLEYREDANGSIAGWTTAEYMDIASQFYLLYSTPPYFEQYTDIMITATASSTDQRVSAGFNLVLIQDRA